MVIKTCCLKLEAGSALVILKWAQHRSVVNRNKGESRERTIDGYLKAI